MATSSLVSKIEERKAPAAGVALPVLLPYSTLLHLLLPTLFVVFDGISVKENNRRRRRASAKEAENQSSSIEAAAKERKKRKLAAK